MDTIPNLLTTEQVARRVGKSASTINRWVTQGRLTPDFQVDGYNGDRLYAPSTVLALMSGDKHDQTSD